MNIKKFLLPLFGINIFLITGILYIVLHLTDTEYFIPAIIGLFIIHLVCIFGFLYYIFNKIFDTTNRKILSVYQKPYKEGQNISLDNTPLKAISRNPSFLFIKKVDYEEFFFSEQHLYILNRSKAKIYTFALSEITEIKRSFFQMNSRYVWTIKIKPLTGELISFNLLPKDTIFDSTSFGDFYKKMQAIKPEVIKSKNNLFF